MFHRSNLRPYSYFQKSGNQRVLSRARFRNETRLNSLVLRPDVGRHLTRDKGDEVEVLNHAGISERDVRVVAELVQADGSIDVPRRRELGGVRGGDALICGWAEKVADHSRV